MSKFELVKRLRKDVRSVCKGDWSHLELAEKTKQDFIGVLDSVNRSYPQFLEFFHWKPALHLTDILIALNFIHAWKSEKLSFGNADLEKVAEILTHVKYESDHEWISLEDLTYLRSMTKGQCVSVVTKMLHLINPHKYGILDPHVYRYLTGECLDEAMAEKGPAICFKYWDTLRGVIGENDVSDIQRQIEAWLEYKVSTIRAIELVIFVNGKMNSLAENGSVNLEKQHAKTASPALQPV